jgi:quinol monooxygenase YgiN
MVHVVASIRIKAGRVAEFLRIFAENVPAVRKERGCIDYFPAVDVNTGLAPQVTDPEVVTIIERWESVEALRDHAVAPHMLAYRNKVAGIVEDVSFKVLQEA